MTMHVLSATQHIYLIVPNLDYQDVFDLTSQRSRNFVADPLSNAVSNPQYPKLSVQALKEF